MHDSDIQNNETCTLSSTFSWLFLLDYRLLAQRGRFHIYFPLHATRTPNSTFTHSNSVAVKTRHPIWSQIYLLRTFFLVKVPSLLLSCMNDVKTNTAQASFLLQLVLKKILLCFDKNCVVWMLCTNRPCHIRKQSYQNIFQRPNLTNHLQQISFTTQKYILVMKETFG